MSGHTNTVSMHDFAQRHKNELAKLFKMQKKRIPSRQTIGRILQHIDKANLIQIFKTWAKSYVKDIDIVSMDGKVIRGTVENYNNSLQRYINLVSAFSNKRKQILGLKEANEKGGEIQAVKRLIQELDLEGGIITLDALHCQKDTVKEIVKKKNNYVIGVKGNQKKLVKQIKKTV
jgi:NADH/NAD ratio-sensing transcriptional regulator Rex